MPSEKPKFIDYLERPSKAKKAKKKKGNFLKNLGKAIMQGPNERISRAKRMAEKLKKKKQS